MKYKKIGVITILAFLVAVASLGIGYSSLNTTLKVNGIAKVSSKELLPEPTNIHDIKTTTPTTMVTPTINNNEITTSLSFNQLGENAFFKFDFVNNKRENILIKEIKIIGLEEYQKYLSYKIENLSPNEIIKQQETKKDISFNITYQNELLNDNSLVQNIKIPELKIIIVYEEIKKGE